MFFNFYNKESNGFTVALNDNYLKLKLTEQEFIQKVRKFEVPPNNFDH